MAGLAHIQVIRRLQEAALAISPTPASLVIFGSYARSEATAGSDLDVLAVRAGGVDFDDDEWFDSLDAWRSTAGHLTGLPVELMDASEDEVPHLLARPGRTVWRAVQDEGFVVAGSPLDHVGIAARA